MREIKFRAWNGKKLGYSYDKDLERLFALKRVCSTEPLFEQFTGLRDKNGREIYEGDITLFNVLPDKHFSENGLSDQHEAVVYNYCEYSYGPWRIGCCTNVKVIGNIHENPELLNG